MLGGATAAALAIARLARASQHEAFERAASSHRCQRRRLRPAMKDCDFRRKPPCNACSRLQRKGSRRLGAAGGWRPRAPRHPNPGPRCLSRRCPGPRRFRPQPRRCARPSPPRLMTQRNPKSAAAAPDLQLVQPEPRRSRGAQARTSPPCRRIIATANRSHAADRLLPSAVFGYNWPSFPYERSTPLFDSSIRYWPVAAP